MANIDFRQAAPAMQYVGDAATIDLFGANFLFSRDGAWQPGEVSRPYKAFADETGLSTLRYPGGTMTEEKFDMANPNNEGDTTAGKKGLVPMTAFLEYAASIEATVTIVLPTYRLFTNQFDSLGQRIIDPEAKVLVSNFIQFALAEAKLAGTKIDGFELGNEWFVDNTEIFGFRMTPIEYGRIANFLAGIVQSEIDTYNLNQPSWDKTDPDIIVQVGPGGNAEWYSREELKLPSAGANAEISATEVIFNQISDPTSRAAIDGIVTHRYLMGTDEAISGWAYKPFTYWENLAQKTPGFKADLRKYVSEWNVSSRNQDEIGLKQFDSMVLLAREMMLAGVDVADVWAVQQNNSTKLVYNTGLKDSPYGGLTFGGTAFDMMAAQLPGLRVIQSSETLAGLQSVMFGSDSSVVHFLTNKTGVLRNDSFNKLTFPAGTTHVSIYEVTVGIDGRPTVAVRTYPIAEMPSIVVLELSIDETVMMVFTKGTSGATIEGYDLADNLVGTTGSDSIMGGALDDTINGSGGSDTIWAEAGNDQLFGGDGNDSLVGGSGNDLVYGGAGDDCIDWDWGTDTLFGGSGNDTLSLKGLQHSVFVDLGVAGPFLLSSIGLTIGEFENLIAGDGHDSIRGNTATNLIDGTGGDDIIDGLGGDDTLIGGNGNDMIVGGSGDDRVDAGIGNDLLKGDEGGDLLDGGEGDDAIFGGDGADICSGGAGDDVLNGDVGWDVLLAGSGDDTVFGGNGDDRVFADAGDDFVSCDDGDDYGNGGGGDDWILGGVGDDTLSGAEGDDIIFGDSPLGIPAWFLRGLYDPQVLALTLKAILEGTVAQAVSLDHDYISGGLGNDLLFGGLENDKLFGDGDDDWLFGLGGEDTLGGGLGADNFVVDFEAGGRTIIVDFHNDTDTLVLTGFSNLGEISASSFVDLFASKVDGGVLLDFRNGTEVLLNVLYNPASLYDDLMLL